MNSSYDGYDWTKWRNTGLDAWSQNVTVYQNQLVMVWSSLHDSNIWYGTSTDSLKWEIVGKTGSNTTTTPSVTTINVQGNQRMILVFTDNGGNGEVWSSYHPGSNGGWNSVQKNRRIEFEFPPLSRAFRQPRRRALISCSWRMIQPRAAHSSSLQLVLQTLRGPSGRPPFN
jgi:hypothetical protein